jgi:uncharacterized protein (TIGR03663 family)
MHTDEAVHAVKFGALLEEGIYRYDKNEYHGPTLNYFTLVPALLKARKTLGSLDESTLRIVPACAGLGLILLLFLLINGFGRKLIIAVASITAISPLLIFYSRYYIQETLLVFFIFSSIVSVYRFIMTRKIGWLIFTGIFLGLMHATKETALINFLLMIAAFCLTLIVRFKKTVELKKYLQSFSPWYIILVAGTAMIISALFYSSFFSNLRGIPDSLTTYEVYLGKAGSNDIHNHPWYYYLQLLSFSKSPSGMVWSELWIIIAACFGFYSLIRNRNTNSVHYYLILFIGIYTILLLLLYSAIPYKTPWNMLGFYHGLIILAGYGIIQFFTDNKKMVAKIPAIIFLLAGSFHLLAQVYILNFKTPSDPDNPYVYAHTGNDIYKIVTRIDSVAFMSYQGNNLHVEIIFPGHDYWPLPWYLRNYQNVGYRDSVYFSQPIAPIILASPAFEKEIIRGLYEFPPPGQRYLYLPLFEHYTELRPRVEIRGYIRKDIWDNYTRFRNNEVIK